jgi:hypothetical protein
METQELTLKQELREIFDKLPSAYPSKLTEDVLKCINFSLLESLVSKMMAKAYYRGKHEALDSLESMVNETFAKY